MVRSTKLHILFFAALLLLSGCHKTPPQKPSQRSGQELATDTTITSLMDINRHLAELADAKVAAYVDSVQRVTKDTFAMMSCGGWKRRRHIEERRAALFADSPQYRERWEVRLKTYRLDGRLLSDTKGTYIVKHYDLPIAVEEAMEDMCAGETSDVVAPWYTAYGFRGKKPVPPYENVVFKITLIEKVN